MVGGISSLNGEACMKKLDKDRIRYGKSRMPLFQTAFRKYQDTNSVCLKVIYKYMYKICRSRRIVEMPINVKIGEGLYFGHAYRIVINPEAVIGNNCNIHGGVLIGQENRGERKGAPKIGNEVWIGMNAVVVGNISIGDDVLIAPNSYINCDVPSHSIVFGNPCIIKESKNATGGYINNKVID